MRSGRYDPVIFLLQSQYDETFQTRLHSFHLIKYIQVNSTLFKVGNHHKRGHKTPDDLQTNALKKSQMQMTNKTQHERTTTIKTKQTKQEKKVSSCTVERGDLCLGEGQAATSSSRGPSHRGKPPRTYSHLQTMVVSAISMCLGLNPRLLCCKAAALTTAPLFHKLIYLFYS